MTIEEEDTASFTDISEQCGEVIGHSESTDENYEVNDEEDAVPYYLQ